PMWRKCMHAKYGYFDESFESAGDWEFWLRMAETETFLRLDEFLGLYLSSPTSVEHRNRELACQENLRVHQRYIHRADRLKTAWAASGTTVTNKALIGWLDELQVGQMLSAKGTPGRDDTFLAFELVLEGSADLVIVQGFVQSIDHETNALRILNRDLALPSGIEVRDSQGCLTDRKALKAADRVRLWGKCAEPEEFTPENIVMIEAASFGLEELRGNVGRIDRAHRTVHVAGFAVMVSEKTTIRSLMSSHK
ncbi:MAG TPA: hypothetical protein VJA16_00425, partial [Thermoanaerobaculia bacterium]